MNKTKLAGLVGGLLLCGQAMSYEAGDWLVRGGLTSVAPDESAGNIFVNGIDLGLSLTVDNNTQLGLTLAYFITDKINVEVLAATPFKHDVNFSVNDPLGTGTQLGEVTHLPPTVTVNYYFADADASFQPYAGVGVNYTLFFDEEFTGPNAGVGFDDLSLSNSLGVAATLGFDYAINDSWHINASARWIDINTEATFNLGGLGGEVQDIEIDPYVYSIMLGYKF